MVFGTFGLITVQLLKLFILGEGFEKTNFVHLKRQKLSKFASNFFNEFSGFESALFRVGKGQTAYYIYRHFEGNNEEIIYKRRGFFLL